MDSPLPKLSPFVDEGIIGSVDVKEGQLSNVTDLVSVAFKDNQQGEAVEEWNEDDESDASWSSDSAIGDALDYLDSKVDDDAIDGAITLNTWRPNANGGVHARRNASALQPPSNRAQKFANHVRASPLDEWEGRNVNMSNSVTTAMRENIRDMAIGTVRFTEKADRATVEQALDPRTRMVLYKMMNRKLFSDMNGCISTGKEANVYHATKDDGAELAIKVYKTSILEFKDRGRYIQGDFRFRFGSSNRNPRQMVKLWAEKERRNLMRLKSAGIRCPTPLHLKLHILVMEFIGENGWAAPRLKEVDLSLDRLCECYREVVIIMRTLYQKCKLVHGDLSEFNILYYEGHLYVIDVSQGVDLDHPHTLDFLRRDCVNISDFFRKRGVAVMTIRELFDFIVDPLITDESIDSYLEEVQEKISARGNKLSPEDELADSVFIQSYIPKTLDSVRNAEEDVNKITSGQGTDDLNYQTITGLKHALQNQPASGEKNDNPMANVDPQEQPDLTDSESNSESEEEEEDEERSDGDRKQDVSDPADRKAARKENKKKVKEEKREARKHKVPKADKKRKKKLAKSIKTR